MTPVARLRQGVPGLACLLALAACTAPEATRVPDANGRVTRAMISPLMDLNLLREKIPGVLLQAKDGPYRQPETPACDALASEVLELDRVLGPDLDVAKGEKPGLVERGTVAARDAALRALKGATEDVIPYRSWVRKLTGAERHSREVAAAIAAGIVRRAYLKGVGQSQGCEAPAAPLPQPAAD